MKKVLRSLRIRLFLAGLGAIYLPVVIMLTAFISFSSDEQVFVNDSSASVSESTPVSPWVYVTAVALIPLSIAMAWWWSGRAVRPVEAAMSIQQQLIEEASHELRTPLSVLTSNAEVLLAHPEPTMDDFRTGLRRSEAAANRMRVTLDDLLVRARGRTRTISRRPTRVADLVASVIGQLQPVATAAGVSLESSGSPQVEAAIDAATVERALANLVANAIQHSSPGDTVRVDFSTSASEIVLVVTDQGPGISVEEQARVFERYWQGEDSSGAGIGLAIVEQIALAHGGSVGVESPVADGRGTRFRFTVMS